MKVFIFGGDGMLGHKAWQVLKDDMDVFMTIKDDFSEIKQFGIFDEKKTIPNVDILDFPLVEKTFRQVKPDIVLNCIGIVKQKEEAKDSISSIEINSLFPHRLQKLCEDTDARLIHISTDCVFSGKKGNYTEKDYPDPLDLYGRSKLMGEVVSGKVLTLRTSIIGHELSTRHALVEWFLGQKGKTVKGFGRAIYSGFPTVVFCGILKDIITRHKDLRGLYHVSSSPIDKYALLCLIKAVYDLDIEIERYDDFACDRSLNSDVFRKLTDFECMNWEDMIKLMHEDRKAYKKRN